MKLKLIGKSKKILKISKKFGIEIISKSKVNINYDSALIIDNGCCFDLKRLTIKEIENLIMQVVKSIKAS